jgi:acetoin utilization deacetylase AcuC-like enzyme
MFAMDTMTLIGPGTWEAARAGAACALTAADLVIDGQPRTYAAVRPPGHHVGRTFYGGSCYLNNAALAAERLSNHGAVAVIDLDAHHGNGTQQIFYATDRVRYGSLHIDPDAGYFPHWVGRATERGTGPGYGANLNLPLPPGTDDGKWLDGLKRLLEFSHEVDYLVVSLGVDSFSGDPESPLEVSVDAHHQAGRLIGELGLPTVVVQEGGYVVDRLGELVVEFLNGLADG